MTVCPEGDTLVTVGNALGWNPEVLRHLGQCESCMARLQILARMHTVLTEELDPGPTLTRDVLASLPTEAPSAGDRMMRGLTVLTTPLLAGLTALFGAAWIAQVDGIESSFPITVFGLVAAAITFAWDLTTRSRVVRAQ